MSGRKNAPSPVSWESINKRIEIWVKGVEPGIWRHADCLTSMPFLKKMEVMCMIVFERLKFQPVNSDDEFQFSCSNCGECCRNIKEAVMVESLDLFRIARYMKLTTAEAMEAYTVPAFLSRAFPILLMKTKPHRDACVFLKDGKCSIHSIKPRTCRLYPLNAGPVDKSKSNFQYFIVSQRPHHFAGQRHRVGNWMGAHFKPEDRAFLLTEYEMAAEAGRLIRQIDAEHDDSIISAMLILRFFMFDIAQEFQPQYERNMASLLNKLKDLTKKGGRDDG